MMRPWLFNPEKFIQILWYVKVIFTLVRYVVKIMWSLMGFIITAKKQRFCIKSASVMLNHGQFWYREIVKNLPSFFLPDIKANFFKRWVIKKLISITLNRFWVNFFCIKDEVFKWVCNFPSFSCMKWPFKFWCEGPHPHFFSFRSSQILLEYSQARPWLTKIFWWYNK